MKMSIGLKLGYLMLAVGLIVPRAYAQEQEESSTPNFYHFGDIGLTEPMEHTFEFQNEGTEPLLVENVEMTPPLAVTKMNAKILPGETGRITVKLGEEERVRGEYSSPVVVNFKNRDQKEMVFWVKGQIVRPIEVLPMSAIFLTAQRGDEKSAS